MTDAAACLKQKLLAGPVMVEAFMAFCLADPTFGSYQTRNPIARDFITAPEISQMFGEMMGLLYANFCLTHNTLAAWVELGPGRGTLSADALRAAAPHVLKSDVHLVETSPLLRDVQKAKLAHLSPTWHETIDTLPNDKPLFIVANEFFDALPVQQFVFGDGVWRLRHIMNGPNGLVFDLGQVASPPLLPKEQPKPSTVFEYPRLGLQIFDDLCQRLIKQTGHMIIVDYGPRESGYGDTLQAVFQGQKVDVFSHIGRADLSCHVPFPLFRNHGERHYPSLSCQLTDQGRFLQSHGMLTRLASLIRHNPDEADALSKAYHRLTHPTQMGTLFKVLEVVSPFPL